MKELTTLRKILGSWQAVAEELGVSSRTLYRYRVIPGKRGVPVSMRKLIKMKLQFIQLND